MKSKPRLCRVSRPGLCCFPVRTTLGHISGLLGLLALSDRLGSPVCRHPSDNRAMAGMFRGWYNIRAHGVPVGRKVSVGILIRLVGLLRADC
jgi:hypothetical protein